MAKTLTEAQIARLLKRADLYPHQLTREEKNQLSWLRAIEEKARDTLKDEIKKEA